MKLFRMAILGFLPGLFISCGSYFNQPLKMQPARLGESTQITSSLKQLPMPEELVVVGVYNFRDLTGQYKASDLGSTFSTAVTQGATSILIKALEDSGWFTPIERENIGNLLNERNIIRSTRDEYIDKGDSKAPNLPPLLYAGILLEGGIVSYDTNIMTGGVGARYFGVGGSTQYRQDRVTIYLRAVSTSSGKILKTVYISKTILSKALDASLFKYVNFQRLLEVETGFTRNEPVQLAVTAAIEKAVESLVLEGIQDHLWNPREQELGFQAVKQYQNEERQADLTELYNRKIIDRGTQGALEVRLGTSLLSGDYSDHQFGFMAKVGYTKPIIPHLSYNISGNFFELTNGGSFQQKFAGLDVNAQFNVLPYDDLAPYIYGGAGYIFSVNPNGPESVPNSFLKMQYGAGIEYMVSRKIGLAAFAEHNLGFSDEIDYIKNGKRDDQYFNFGIGINFYLNRSKQKTSNLKR